MSKVSKPVIDKMLRDQIFDMLLHENTFADMFHKVNDRQYGIIMVDGNGVERYVRIGAIVAEIREDMTATELMNSEIADYNEKQAVKAEKEKAKQEKIAKDKAKREAEAKAKEEGGQE